MHAGNMLYLYLVAPNVRIKLFTDKEVTNWIYNKLKDKKYHEILKLTKEEFIEQEKTKKQREEDADKTTTQRSKVRKVTIIRFNIQRVVSGRA